MLVLAIKPQAFKAAVADAKPFIGEHTLVLSIMAGITISALTQAFGTHKIIRAMPNTPGQIGQGVTAYVAAPGEKRVGETLRQCEPEDLLKFGLIPEFIGRLPVIATLEDLDEPALIRILTEPKNALSKQYQKLFDMEGVKLAFSIDALSSISKRAIERKTGARGLRSILEGILLDTMFDLPSMEGVTEVVVDRDVVEGRKDPVRVLGGKEKKEAAA